MKNIPTDVTLTAMHTNNSIKGLLRLNKERTIINRPFYKDMTQEKGITLVALIITIIVLIILAAVTIFAFTESGLLQTASKGAENYANAQEYEKQIMNNIEKIANEAVRNITEVGTGGNPQNPAEGIKEPELEITEITNKTLKINVTNDYKEDVQFEYYVNGIKIREKTSEKICNVENLSFNTEYEIKVIAYLEEEKKETKTVARTTMTDILILFDNGNQCEEVTGGWISGYTGGGNSSVGEATMSNVMSIKTWGIWCGYGFQTQKQINISEYSSIVIEIEHDNIAYNSGSAVFYLGITISGNFSSYDSYTEYRDLCESKIATHDITNVTGNFYVKVSAVHGRELSVSRMYLVK